MTAGAVEQPTRHELVLFVVLAFAISWAMHIPLALATLRSGDPTASAGSPLNLLAPWGPAVAAIIMTAVVMGRRGPGTLFRQLRVWRVGIWWYLIAVLLPAGLWLVGRSLDALFGRSYTVESVATDPDLAPYLAGFLIGAFIYTLGEELGWRAYALPRLQQHRSALIAALVIGVLWGLWHVPTFIAQGHTGTGLVPLAVSPIAASVLFTWVYNSTGGSLLLVWLFHTASTITGYLLGDVPTVTDELVGVAAAVVVVLVAGSTDLSRSRPRQRLGRHRLAARTGGVGVGAHSGHLAKRCRLLLLVLGIVSVVVAACGGDDASPAAQSGTSPPPPSGTIATPTSDTLSRGEVARLFHYDRRRPFAITRVGLTARLPPARDLDGVTVQSITYASPKGGEVPALVVVPNGKGPFPGVIVQHGLPDTKEGMLPAGIDLARTGAVAVLIDAPFNRPQQGRVRSDPLTFTPKDRDEQVQLIVDLRRAVDLLVARPDVNNKQLAYFGVSYGAAMGGLLAGVEDRLKAYVLAVGDGGLVSHFAGPDDTDGPLQALPVREQERWLAAMRPIEPINFIGQAAPAALLFLAGTKDESVAPEDARRFHQAASQPKEVRWYEAGHFLNCTARQDTMVWLARHIRIDPARSTCPP